MKGKYDEILGKWFANRTADDVLREQAADVRRQRGHLENEAHDLARDAMGAAFPEIEFGVSVVQVTKTISSYRSTGRKMRYTGIVNFAELEAVRGENEPRLRARMHRITKPKRGAWHVTDEALDLGCNYVLVASGGNENFFPEFAEWAVIGNVIEHVTKELHYDKTKRGTVGYKVKLS